MRIVRHGSGIRRLNKKEPAVNASDWRYLLPQSLQSPYLYIVGSKRVFCAMHCSIQTERVEDFPPLGNQGTMAKGQLEHFVASSESYELIIWELAIDHFSWFVTPRYLERAFQQVRELTKEDDFLYLAVKRSPMVFTGVQQIMNLLQRAGFHNCRAYYVLPSHAYPIAFVPANDSSLMSYYLDHVAFARSSKRKLVITLARALSCLKLSNLFLSVVPYFCIVAQRGG